MNSDVSFGRVRGNEPKSVWEFRLSLVLHRATIFRRNGCGVQQNKTNFHMKGFAQELALKLEAKGSSDAVGYFH